MLHTMTAPPGSFAGILLSEVNEHEGRLTFEMHDLMAAFAKANKKNPKVPLLVPGPGTRGLLGHTKAKAPAPVPAPVK